MATLGEAFIDVRADTSAFNASLAAGLKGALATAQAEANVAFGRIAATGAKAAGSIVTPFRQALTGIAGEFSRLGQIWTNETIDITAVTAATARSLRTEFGVATTAISAEFDALSAKVSSAIVRAVQTGETSLIRLAAVARSTAGVLSAEFKAAGATAAAGVQGPLRVAIEAIAKDFQELRAAPLKFESDVTAAGRLAAEHLASSLGIAAGTMTAEIQTAAKAIGAALKAAGDSGASLSRIAADAAIAAEAARATLVAALNEVVAAELRVSQGARVMAAQVAAATTAAAATLGGELGAAIGVVIADLGALATTGNLTAADIASAVTVAANAIRGEFSGATRLAAVDFEALLNIATHDFRLMAAAGTASAKEIQASYAKAIADVVAELRVVGTVAEKSFGSTAIAASAAARKINATFGKGLAADLANSIQNIALGFAKMFAGVTAGATVAAGAIGLAVGAVGTSLFSQLEAIQEGLKGIFAGISATDAEAAAAKAGKAFTKQAEIDAVKAGQTFGKEFFTQLQAFAQFSPFELPEIGAAAQKLIPALGLDQLGSVEKTGQAVINILTDIGNALATSGKVGKEGSDGLNRIAIALGQISSFGKLTFDNLNQISNALPTFARQKLFDNLTKQANAAQVTIKNTRKVTVDEVKKLTQSVDGIPAPAALEAILETFRNIPGAGKQAVEGLDGVIRELDAMDRLSLTLGAQLSQFKDTVKIGFFNSFQGVADQFKRDLDPLAKTVSGALDTLTTQAVAPLFTQISPLLQSFLPVLADALVPLIGLFGDLLTALAPAGTVIVKTFGEIATAVGPGLTAIAEALSGALLDALPTIVPAFATLGDALVQAAPAVTALVEALIPLIPILATLLAGALQVIAPLLEAIAPVVEFMAKAFLKLLEIPGVAEIFGTLAIALVAIVAVAGPILTFLGTLGPAMVGVEAVMALLATTTGSLVIDLLLLAAPVVAIVAGIALLVAGFILAYKKSETFRKIVNKTFDTIVRVVGGAVKALVTVFGKLIDFYLFGFQKILEGLGHLPDWLGGGVFDAAAEGLKRLREGVSDAVDLINSKIDSVTRFITIEIEVNTKFTEGVQGGALNEVNSEKAIANDPKRRARLAAEAKKAADAAAKSLALGKRPPATTDTRIPGSGDALKGIKEDAAKKAKDAADKAKAAADAFREKIRQILASLDADFRDTLVKGTGKEIDNALDALATKIKAAFKGKKTDVDDVLVKTIEVANKKLVKLANERERILDRLDKATKRAEEAASGVRSFADVTALDFSKTVDGVAKTVTKLNIATLDVAGSFQVVSKTLETDAKAADEAVKHTADEFAAALAARLKAIQDFQANIDTLIKKGFKRGIIDQIISAGVEGGAATAEALAGASKQTKDAINKTQAEIDKAAKDLGDTAAENLFRSGGNIVDGLIQGLKDRKSEIAKEMTSIAETLIAAIRKTLKEASPSKVMRGIGRNAGRGLTLGMHDTLGDVLAASTKMARAAMPTMAPVSLGALQGAGDGQSMTALRQQLAAGRSAAPSLDTSGIVAAIQGARATREINAPVTIHAGGLDAAGTERVVRSQLAASLGRAGRR